MSEYTEGYQLTLEELAVLFSLCGKRTMVGFRADEVSEITEEKLWSACSNLVRDGLLSQKKERYVMPRELAVLMVPVVLCKKVLVMTPGSDRFSQVIYYGDEAQTLVERSVHGGFVLSGRPRETLTEDLVERLELDCHQEVLPDASAPDTSADGLWAALMQDAEVLLERLDLDTGSRTGWLRIIRQGIFRWIQYTEGDKVLDKPLTPENMTQLLQQFLKGA